MTQRFHLWILYTLAALAGLSFMGGIMFVAWTYR